MAQTAWRGREQAYEWERRDQMRRRKWGASKDPGVYVAAVRWMELEQLAWLAWLAHTAVEGYLTRGEYVPHVVEWKG